MSSNNKKTLTNRISLFKPKRDMCLIVILVQWHLSQTGTGFMTSKQIYIQFVHQRAAKASDFKIDQSK